MMWIFAADWIEPALAALLVIVLMLWTGVLSWSDITNNKAAWNTFVWFATLVHWPTASPPPALSPGWVKRAAR
ncbi:L-tartrate/succinate antiporter [Klebsiella pneumoniae]|nr:L-tartrate/succinate antiporter [Klebsiella pneumoniae]